MYQYVTDKEFLKKSYSMCADLVNQLVQELKSYGIQAKMSTVGSKKRGLITQNGREPIDYDFNLWVSSADDFNIQGNPGRLKQEVIKAFNFVLSKNGWANCEDSTSAITTKKHQLRESSRIMFKIDICIVRKAGQGTWYRLIHKKTGYTWLDQYYWMQGPSTTGIEEKEKFLKPDHWEEVREVYLQKKNMYLERQEMDNHPSYNCYIEAVNEVYTRRYKSKSLGYFSIITF